MVEMVYPLLIAHLVGDFALQADWMIRLKKERGPLGVMPHIGVIALLTLGAVYPVLPRWWPYCVAIVASHLLIDMAKVAADQRLRSPRWALPLFLVDQLLHWAVILAVVEHARAAGLATFWPLTRLQGNSLLLFLVGGFVVGIILRVMAPGVAWPNRWPATLARLALVLLALRGAMWAAPLPILLALAYHHGRGQPLTTPVYVEMLGGGAVALLLGLLFPHLT